MKVVYNWLKQFVDVTASPADLRARLSLVGIAVDSIEETAAGPVLDAEVTANRPDCLGHLGIAREVAAIYRLPLKPLHPKLKESAEKAADATRVEIQAPELCGRFTARVLRGVKVQPSPDWLRQGLEAIGEKSINNVVDVTNYVMFELGHPLHAYDFDKLAEKRIVVRRAKPGEKIRTLDGAERTLTKDMCVIADAARAIGIGGVMGGAETEIIFQHAEYSARVRLVRSHRRAPHFEGARPAFGSFLSLRTRRRSRNGRTGLAARGGIDSTTRRRRDSRGRCGYLSPSRAGKENRAFAQGTAARDGRGRSGPRHRGDFERARISSRARGRQSRQRWFACGDLGMPASFLAAAM